MPDTPSRRLASARLAGQLVPALGAALDAVPSGLTRFAVDGLGLLAWVLAPGRRRATAGNYAALLRQPAQAPLVRRLVRRAFKQYGRMSLEFFTLSRTCDEQLLADAQVYGREHFDAALARGRGAILTLPHLGNWDLAARLCLAMGYPLTAVVEDDWSAEFAGQMRARFGLRVVPRARSLRPLLRALGRNEPVALLCDVVPPGAHGVVVRFAGQRAYLPVGPARLAIASGAPLIPCAAVRLADGRPSIGTNGPIYPQSSAAVRNTGRAPASDEQIHRLMQAVATQFEQLILQHPEQWYAFRSLGSVEASHAA